jgi:hypothetical protein
MVGSTNMATDKQTEANRQNAQRSTGPKTAEGRAAVRLNGLKHVLTAQRLILPGENEADFQNLLDSYTTEHEPITPTEHALVTQLGMATWRMRRLYHMEAGYYAYKLKALSDAATRHNLDDFGRLGMVADCSKDTLSTLNRQEARLERSFYKALQELQRLRAERPAKAEKQTQKSQDSADQPAPKPHPEGQVDDLPSPIIADIPDVAPQDAAPSSTS